MRRPAWGDPRPPRERRALRGRERTASAVRACAAIALAGTSFVALASGCVPRARLCTAASDCADKSACVAGRCQIDKPTAKPAVDSARRVVVRPVDVAYVKSGDGPSGGALPTVFVLGKDGGKLFLRFSVAVPATANVVEAYVVLRRSPDVDDDPAPVHLHATRIVDAWQGGSVSWAIQPRSVETRSPSTRVEPGARALVRLDVRELVRHWARREPTDQGIAIVADNETASGSTFALSTLGVERSSTDAVGVGRAGLASASGAPVDAEPYLEIYLR
ncbi:MAG: DNRLRE domain-containing protein [Labilithrix sp.]|nr:DNRLRE domain-containing protein [Labilithrix sp.]